MSSAMPSESTSVRVSTNYLMWSAIHVRVNANRASWSVICETWNVTCEIWSGEMLNDVIQSAIRICGIWSDATQSGENAIRSCSW